MRGVEAVQGTHEWKEANYALVRISLNPSEVRLEHLSEHALTVPRNVHELAELLYEDADPVRQELVGQQRVRVVFTDDVLPKVADRRPDPLQRHLMVTQGAQDMQLCQVVER
jgi:hypothetical protein